MSAEFYIDFKDASWYSKNILKLRKEIEKLDTYVESSDGSFWLCELNKEALGPKDWDFAIRIFLENEYIFLEISSHSLKVSNDLKNFLGYLRKETAISVRDEDYEESGW